MGEQSDRFRQLASGLVIDLNEIEWEAVRASGPGGQNVNKVSSAIHLRYDLKAASLPERVRDRLLRSADRRVSAEGVLVLKAQRFRTQRQNREDALDRLLTLIGEAAREPKRRVPTRPTRGSVEKRHKKKDINSKNKVLRRKPSIES